MGERRQAQGVCSNKGHCLRARCIELVSMISKVKDINQKPDTLSCGEGVTTVLIEGAPPKEQVCS